ncbi:MAG: RagB/SusD family nutrient uptake outer membrane protein [Bacteroidales bacterium]|nr:RagB/SusD family nutrient uptake outer membrane protein [Bacteroidales bacterium]
MNNILKKTIGAALMAVVMTGLLSCSLKEDTSSISTPDNFFRNYAECQSVVNSCYIPLKSIYTYQYFLAVECVSDIMYCPSGTLDAQLDISPVKPRFGTTVWKQCYLGVQRCNFAIPGIENCEELTEAEKTELLCEAKVLRALYYWHLTCFFCDVPFYLCDVSDTQTLLEVAELPRMSADSTRAELIKDLNQIAPLVAQTRTSDNKEQRLGAAAAWMLVAKFAAWNQDWNEVVSACTKLEAIYGDLNQYPLSDIPFRYKNTPESIFEIQHTYTEGGLAYVSNVACVTTPVRSKDDIYDGVQIPELGKTAKTWQPAYANVYFCQGLMPRRGRDQRSYYNVAWEWEGKAFEKVTSRPYPGPKFWCPDMKEGNDDNNYKVFRYADAILLKAEALCELNQLQESVRYLDMTRTRAGLSGYVLRTQFRLREEIRSERARELFGEFQRKYDLVRWGIWYEAMTDYNDYSTLVSNMKPCHRYYPIPDTQVVYSKNNLDNKEYALYGM